MNIKKHKYIVTLNRKYRELNSMFYKMYFTFQKIKNKAIINKNLKKNIFAVDIYSQMGIGANLVWALEIMAFCNEEKLTPQIKFTYPNAKQKDDIFGYYFEIRNPSGTTKPIRFAKMRNFDDLNLGFPWNFNEKLNLELADNLIKKHLVIKSNILKEVEDFQSKHFNNKHILGVHYRGTDKKLEAEQITYETVERNINLYLTKYPETSGVFISSDDNNFIDYMENSGISCPIIYNDDSFRSSDDTPIHTAKNNLYEINKDAIINCLLLSKCNSLMKTASILSDWSKLFNPNLQVILLSKPYQNFRFFPGKEFYENVLFVPIE